MRPDPLIIGLAGPAGAGKDTAADYLCSHHGFVRHAFAAPLKSMLEMLLIEAGQDYAYIHDPKLKEQAIPGLGVSYRHMAQTLGTEWGRALAPDFWLRVAGQALGLPDAPIHDRIVMTDVRFPNEADWISSKGGRIVRLFRHVPAVRAHESEMHIGSITPWFAIDNTSSVEWLHEQLDEMVSRLPTGAPV